MLLSKENVKSKLCPGPNKLANSCEANYFYENFAKSYENQELRRLEYDCYFSDNIIYTIYCIVDFKTFDEAQATDYTRSGIIASKSPLDHCVFPQE
ncbi:hypothetical protein PUN28_006926 [Cardiocondyla obscurior]|uniref:Uncharacterized protein n=1 Tax=Cardiocondyla obscurior TaxID=286306 RepID=A0AAW2G289_9HYME